MRADCNNANGKEFGRFECDRVHHTSNIVKCIAKPDSGEEDTEKKPVGTDHLMKAGPLDFHALFLFTSIHQRPSATGL
jgi:hypothetical protein